MRGSLLVGLLISLGGCAQPAPPPADPVADGAATAQPTGDAVLGSAVLPGSTETAGQPFDDVLGWNDAKGPEILAAKPEAANYVQAVAAYRQFVTGHPEDAKATYAAVKPSLNGVAEWPETPDLKTLLLAVRLGGEQAMEAGVDPLPVPCAPLRNHIEAREAFGGMWGSTKDVEVSRMRWSCLPEAVQLGTDIEALAMALDEAVPLPDGTMYQAMNLDVWGDLAWARLQPGYIAVGGDEAKLREAAVEKLGGKKKAIGPARDALVASLAPDIQRAAPTLSAADAKSRAEATVDKLIVSRIQIATESVQPD